MTAPRQDWIQCPAGELQQLSLRLLWRRRIHVIALAAAGVLATAFVGLAVQVSAALFDDSPSPNASGCEGECAPSATPSGANDCTAPPTAQ